MRKISTLQKDYAELLYDKEHVICNRMIGTTDGYDITFIESFEEAKNRNNTLKVIFTETPPANDEMDIDTIIVLTNSEPHNSGKYLHIEDLTPRLLKEKALNLIPQISVDKASILEKIKKQVGFESDYKEAALSTEVHDGFYNRINIAVLESIRVIVRKKGKTSSFIHSETESLINRINQIKRHIKNHLNTEGSTPAVVMYFSDASSSFEFCRNTKQQAEIQRKYRKYDPQKIKDAIKFADKGLTLEDNTENELIAGIEQERSLIDALITLRASINVSPAIKLTLSNSSAFSKISNLANSARLDGKKANRLMKSVRVAFSEHLDNWLEYADNSPSLPIKLISNLPLEWTHHQGLPLMVRHEVSRIPVTPGYILSKLLLDSKITRLTPSDLKEILFISSFKENDPIRNHLKSKIKIIEEKLNEESIDEYIESNNLNIPKKSSSSIKINIRFNWIEVSTKDDLVAAINNNPCAITIFDLHGGHTLTNGGVIELRDEIIPASNLLGKIKISPIVILSSCDTSPIDKGHQSTAEAFFLCGAKTVISSALPINSDLASTFLMRLLIRLVHYLPAALSINNKIRWSTIVSGMTRRAYYHELIILLHKKYNFPKSTMFNLLFTIGTNLDPLNPNWVTDISKEITSALGISTDELNEFVEKNVQFVECMKYFQLGQPEMIEFSSDLISN